ncbi:MAG: acylphosphatase [Candidatus Melainabacteria bacterium]|nr:acylphosphatase [Candidatus Melainabacteria bacterium]
MLRCLWLRITGRVQGVFYRHSTKQEAQQLGLCGWVRNQADGTVEVLAAGPEAALNLLIAWCKQGPPSAIVDRVEVKWLDPELIRDDKFTEDEVKFNDKFEIR